MIVSILLSSVLSLLLIIAPTTVLSLPGDNAKFRRSHDFPLYTPNGVQMTANEFQMIIPENIKFADTMTSSSGKYQITSVSPLVINSGDVVTISYSTSSTPSTLDWIAAYSPANASVTETVPVKYGYCDDSVGYLTKGVGSLTFNLTNLRSDVAFYYFSGGTSSGVVQNISPQIVTFENINQPLRRRIVPTGAFGEFKLLWSSATSETPIMKWGNISGQYTSTVNATTTTYTREQMCGAPANTTGDDII